MAALEGVYNFEHAGGVFDVHLRSKGRFFCPKFQAAKATWSLGMVEGQGKGVVYIDWQKFGTYELAPTEAGEGVRTFQGSATGKPESWRKMLWKRPFSVAERSLWDSEWEFEHAGGKFNIEFHADGFNHFVCNDFPAHAHWLIEETAEGTAEPTVKIDWAKYGKYELKIHHQGETMAGSAEGKPEAWRKAKRLRSLDAPKQVNCEEFH